MSDIIHEVILEFELINTDGYSDETSMNGDLKYINSNLVKDKIYFLDKGVIYSQVPWNTPESIPFFKAQYDLRQFGTHQLMEFIKVYKNNIISSNNNIPITFTNDSYKPFKCYLDFDGENMFLSPIERVIEYEIIPYYEIINKK